MATFLSEMSLGILDKLFQKHTIVIPTSKEGCPADWLTGASFMTTADCFYNLNGFDPQYFLYFEEVDLFYRAKQAGYGVWSCPKSTVFHISGASTGIYSATKKTKRRTKYWCESRRYFYMKNYGALYFCVLDSIFSICHSLWRIRAKLQKKPDDTPPYFIRDIIKHSYIGKFFIKK